MVLQYYRLTNISHLLPQRNQVMVLKCVLAFKMSFHYYHIYSTRLVLLTSQIHRR